MPFVAKRRARRFRKRVPVARVVRNVLTRQAEKKASFQTPVSNAASGITWIFNSFIATAGIPQDVTVNGRIGDKIRVRAIEVTLKISPVLLAVGNNGSICRIIFYHNRRASGALPSGATIMNGNNILGHVNQEFNKQFTVIRDFTHSMVVTAFNGGVNGSVGPVFQETFRLFPPSTLVESAFGAPERQLRWKQQPRRMPTRRRRI